MANKIVGFFFRKFLIAPIFLCTMTGGPWCAGQSIHFEQLPVQQVLVDGTTVTVAETRIVAPKAESKVVTIYYIPSLKSKNMWKQLAQMQIVARTYAPFFKMVRGTEYWIVPMINSTDSKKSKDPAYEYLVGNGVVTPMWKAEDQTWFNDPKDAD